MPISNHFKAFLHTWLLLLSFAVTYWFTNLLPPKEDVKAGSIGFSLTSIGYT